MNYNGREVLEKCLPSVVEAAKRSPVPCKVIMLDNRSSDDSVEYLRKNFPSVRIEIAKENRVLFSYNDLIPKLDSDVVILFNNDIKVEPDFISPLISHFSSPDIFAVAPMEKNFNGIGYSGGKNKIEFTFGLIKAGPFYGDNNPIMEKPGYTYYNANSAYDRRKFVELGGFDDTFSPFTWEDTDLAYRAWKSGYKFVYEPAGVIYHMESYTFDKEAKRFRKRRMITRRNSFLFAWKNIDDPLMLATHIALLPVNLLIALFSDRTWLPAFFEALQSLPKVLSKRRDRVKYPVKDRDILGMP